MEDEVCGYWICTIKDRMKFSGMRTRAFGMYLRFYDVSSLILS